MRSTCWALLIVAAPLYVCAQTTPAVQHVTAQVVSAIPVTRTLRTPHTTQQCHEVTEAGATPTRALIGSLVGGAAGGLLGSRFGKGSGNSAMTALGAIAGVVGGHYVAEHGIDGYGAPAPQTTTQCTPVTQYTTRRETTGYKVTYEYGGHTYTSVMKNRPGKTIPLAITTSTTVAPAP